MLPFVFAFVGGVESGVGWLVPRVLLASDGMATARVALERILGVATFAAPVALAWRIRRKTAADLPLISVLLVLTNGFWWVWFPTVDAFVWGRSSTASSISRSSRSSACGTTRQRATGTKGARRVCSGSCTAAINVHHFVVDRGIWRLRRDRNYRIVVGDAPVAVGAAPA